MSVFPQPVLDYVISTFLESRSPGYLLVSKKGDLVAWGGRLDRYGVNRLVKGAPVGKQVFFLDGLLPVECSPTLLTSMKTETGIVIDLHFFSTEANDWVLFMDATKEDAERRALQQRVNDLSLLVEKLRSA